MGFLESDLEEIISNASRKDLAKRGLKIDGKLLRQVRIGNYGVADLISVKRHHYNDPYQLHITIYELKKDKVGISTYLQALRYLKGIRRYLEYRNFEYKYHIKIVLIGKTWDEFSIFSYFSEYLNDYMQWDSLDVFTYSYNIDGISFNLCTDVIMKEEGFYNGR